MDSNLQERREHLRSLLLQRTRDLNAHIRHAAFALNALDEGFDPVFNMPPEDTYEVAILHRFDRIIRDSIRMLVCVKSHLHQYLDGMRNVRELVDEVLHGDTNERRAPLGDNHQQNRRL